MTTQPTNTNEMTLVESIQKARKLWGYLAQTGASKDVAYAALNLPADKNDCPLCEYAFKSWTNPNDDPCDICPARSAWDKFIPDDPPWIKEPTPCEHSQSNPWMRWAFADTIFDRKIAASDMCTLLNGVGETNV